MAEPWQGVDSTSDSSARTPVGVAEMTARNSSGKGSYWIVLDVITIVAAAAIATLYKLHTRPLAGARGFWHGTLITGRSTGILLALLSGFAFALVITSRRLHLYNPVRLSSFLREQRLSVQACLYSGLLLAGTLYLIHAEDIPRTIVLLTVTLVTVLLSLRRLAYRLLMYKRFASGAGTRNVLIVGTGPEAHALRHHLESIRHLGYTFKGFIDNPESTSRLTASSGDVVGSFDSLFENARAYFVDEIFFTAPSERGVLQEVLEQAQIQGVDLRVVPEMYDGLAWNSPVEYIG